MIDKRGWIIIEKLFDQPTIQVNTLTRTTGILKNQIEYSLEKINQTLDELQLPLIKFDGARIRITKKSRDHLLDAYLNGDFFELYELNAD